MALDLSHKHLWLLTQKCIFDSILSIFGNGLYKTQYLAEDHLADNRKPAVLDAVKAANISYTKYLNSIIRLCFLNRQMHNPVMNTGDLLMHCTVLISLLTKKQVTMQAQSLTLSREVLEERQQLETIMQSLQVQM